MISNFAITRTPKMVHIFDKICSNGDLDNFFEFVCPVMELARIYNKKRSFFNSALVYIQRPGAAFVTTEEDWLRTFGRYVKPNVQPIVIMHPFYPVDFVYEVEDTYGANIKEAELFGTNQYIEKIVKNLQRAGIYYSENSLGECNSGVITLLRQPIEVTVTKLKYKAGEPFKETINCHYAITVNQNLTDHLKFMTIIHELAHLFCGHLRRVVDKTQNKLSFYDRSEWNLSNELMEYEADATMELFSLGHNLYREFVDLTVAHSPDVGAEKFEKGSVRAIIDAADRINQLLMI